jgi:hypothetical protein
MSWERELESFIPEIENLIGSKDTVILEKLTGMQNKCFEKAKTDSEKFVNCMMDPMKQVAKAEKKLEWRISFDQFKIGECFKNSGGEPLTLEECKIKGRDRINKSFQEFVNSF